MVFNSLHFIWFFIVVYGLYRVLPHRAQNWLLLAASYYFYAAWDWRFLGLLVGSTLVDYSCARALDRVAHPRRRRLILTLSLGFNLTLLGFFKYFNFFADNLHVMFGTFGWTLDFVTLRVLLPVGISFYTFVTMSYVIDVYRREIRATRDLLEFGVFVAYFPHIWSGSRSRWGAMPSTPRRSPRPPGTPASRRRSVTIIGTRLRWSGPGIDRRRRVGSDHERPRRVLQRLRVRAQRRIVVAVQEGPRRQRRAR